MMRSSVNRVSRSPIRPENWPVTWEFIVSEGRSPGAYMLAITGELVLRDSGDRAGRWLDQADDDRDV